MSMQTPEHRPSGVELELSHGYIDDTLFNNDYLIDAFAFWGLESDNAQRGERYRQEAAVIRDRAKVELLCRGVLNPEILKLDTSSAAR